MKPDINPNTLSPYSTLEQIHQGIEDYFECRLSDEQEEQLCRALASTEYRSDEIEECIALMGFKADSKMAASEEGINAVTYDKASDNDKAVVNLIPGQAVPMVGILKKKVRRTWIAVAASFLLAIAIAVPLLTNNVADRNLNGDCYAYVGGTKITDEDVVIRMLMEDFEEFDQSVNQINEDFDSTMDYLSQIIEENENPL